MRARPLHIRRLLAAGALSVGALGLVPAPASADLFPAAVPPMGAPGSTTTVSSSAGCALAGKGVATSYTFTDSKSVSTTEKVTTTAAGTTGFATIPVVVPTGAAVGAATIFVNCDTATLRMGSDTAAFTVASGQMGPPDLAAFPQKVQALAACLQDASKSKSDCFSTFLGMQAPAQLKCISDNLQALVANLQTNLQKMTPPTSSEVSTSLMSVAACLVPASTHSMAPTTTTGGGGASTAPVASTGTAPAATPVAGTPPFTG